MDSSGSLSQLITNGEQIAKSLLDAEVEILAGNVTQRDVVELIRGMRGFAMDITSFLKVIDSMAKENAHDV